jgi:anti-anti-sigma regulatory factor
VIGLRLTVSEAKGGVVIQVDGRLSQASVPELERTCRHAPRPLVLDLTGLVSLDDVGIATLLRLRGEGVALVAPSPYVKLLLSPSGGAG